MIPDTDLEHLTLEDLIRAVELFIEQADSLDAARERHLSNAIVMLRAAR